MAAKGFCAGGSQLIDSPGVIGLTTAIILQEKGGYRVTIVASTFPGDERSSGYTSHWAVSEFLYVSHWSPLISA